METIYSDIATRTGGNIYIGVVGPVRTGKSTLIKRFLEALVIPNIEDPYRQARAIDELPQSGSGKTIMTSEPKFIPEEAVQISPDGTSQLSIRMIDSVGYMVNGAVGAVEDGIERMITTPWYDREIPITQAAELGTKKVMEEHCSIGFVVTTDGSVTDIPRNDYLEAEEKSIRDMQSTGKPFLVIINTKEPGSAQAESAKKHIQKQYGLQPVVADCQSMEADDIVTIFEKLLFSFPMGQLQVYLPRWLDALDPLDPIKTTVYGALVQTAGRIAHLSQAKDALQQLCELEFLQDVSVTSIELSTGNVSCKLRFPDKLFYEVLSEKTNLPIENDGQLLSVLMELSAVKQEYEKVSDALNSAKTTGYGIVMPTADQMQLETPQIVRKGGAFGVKLKAGAPSIHMIRVDIDTEISPMVGGEQQSKELIEYLSDEDPEKLWQSNIFGKSVYTLIQEGLTSKLLHTPGDVHEKFRGTLSRIVNDGATGLICLIL